MTPIRISFEDRKIYISSSFQKKALIPNTDAYDMLQAVRRDYPDYTVAVRQFKKKTSQEHYRGLTYDYMRERIIKVEGENAPAVLQELEDLIFDSKCHSKRYPVIKSWFLARYPEIAKFGMPKGEENVVDMPATSEKTAA